MYEEKENTEDKARVVQLLVSIDLFKIPTLTIAEVAADEQRGYIFISTIIDSNMCRLNC